MNTKNTILSNGHKTTYWVYGNTKAKNSIIFIHGYRGTHHGLEPIAQQDALKDFKIIVPDIPGFGVTDPLNQHYLEDYTKWLKDFINALNLSKKPHLLGHSFGSIIAASYIEKNEKDIDRLILLNPIPSAVGEDGGIIDKGGLLFYKIGSAMPERLGKKWLSSKLMTIIASEFMIVNRTRENRKRINKAHLEHFSDFHSTKSLEESFEASFRNSVKQFAPNINKDILLIVGEKDAIAPIKKQDVLRGLFKNATYHVIPNVGHLTHHETPGEVAKIISEYLN